MHAIKRVSAIIADHLPDFWKLTKSFFNLEYHSGLGVQERADLEEKLVRPSFVKADLLQVTLEQEFDDLIGEILGHYARIVRKYYFGRDFQNEEEDESHSRDGESRHEREHSCASNFLLFYY